MAPLRMVTITLIALATTAALGDDVLYRYEGDVLPYDESAGWRITNPCEDPCSESVTDGRFVLHWAQPADVAIYAFDIAQAPEEPPPTLWIEWHFRSSRPLEANFFTCDAMFIIQYADTSDLVFMYGDAVISFSGDQFVDGLNTKEFHTYRFQSSDGKNYTISVDGLIFISRIDDRPNTAHVFGFVGGGGCQTPPVETTNEWDFVRYGTISFGEKIVASDPPGGFLDPRRYPSLDRFTVTFDSPNYVYLDDITVETGDSPSCVDKENLCPSAVQTRRLDNGDPEVVEIVLDQAIPMDQRTVFTFNDGVVVNTVQYTYIQGDVNADGAFDLADLAELGNCFGVEYPEGR
ncbi:MAG: hypothetical protein IID42_13595, partial [Planctomycetes bacterium]|nr:hypothetical protein [Planctomycetota bacterium]